MYTKNLVAVFEINGVEFKKILGYIPESDHMD